MTYLLPMAVRVGHNPAPGPRQCRTLSPPLPLRKPAQAHASLRKMVSHQRQPGPFWQEPKPASFNKYPEAQDTIRGLSPPQRNLPLATDTGWPTLQHGAIVGFP